MTKQELIDALTIEQNNLSTLLSALPEEGSSMTEFRLKFEIEAQRISIYQIQFEIIKMIEQLS